MSASSFPGPDSPSDLRLPVPPPDSGLVFASLVKNNVIALVYGKTNLHRTLRDFQKRLQVFILNVKAFREKTSPFTLNGEGFSENPFTVEVKKLLHPPNFFPKLAKQQPERRGTLGGRWK